MNVLRKTVARLRVNVARGRLDRMMKTPRIRQELDRLRETELADAQRRLGQLRQELAQETDPRKRRALEQDVRFLGAGRKIQTGPLVPEVENAVDALVRAELGTGKNYWYFRAFADQKKKILKEYGIDWKDPWEMHPDMPM